MEGGGSSWSSPLTQGTMAVIHDASTGPDTGDAATTTFSHTCTGSNRVLYVALGLDGISADAAAACTYNGVSMTRIVNIGLLTSEGQYLAVFELVAPATGSNDVVLSWNVTRNFVAGAVSFTGVNQVVPSSTPLTFSVEGDPDNTNSLLVSSNPNEIVVDAISINNNEDADVTIGAGQTLNFEGTQAGAAGTYAASSREIGAATNTMSWTWTDVPDPDDRVSHAAWAVKAEVPPGLPAGALMGID